jgi:hypothetical protein
MGRVTVGLGASLALCWPALWNGYPLLSNDCITYLYAGWPTIQLLLGQPAVSRVYLRSGIYSAVIFFLHWQVTPWPVIGMAAVLTAWTVWLVVRSLGLRRPLRVYTLLAFGLALLTTASWCISDLLPDSLGAVLYLCLFLLVFARETLRRWEVVAAGVVAGWTATTHPTYLPIAAGLCGLLAVLRVARWGPMLGRGRWLLQAALILLVALAAEVGVNDRIYGRPSVTDPHPPYLMARILADGPSHTYLYVHCGQLHWVVCDAMPRLPWWEGDFLWAPDGIYQRATPQQREQLSAEETPLILGTLRAYPLEQARASWHNFYEQLITFGIPDASPDTPWMEARLDGILPGSRERFLRSRPREQAVHRPIFRGVQEIVTALAAVVVLGLLPWVGRRGAEPLRSRLLGLAAVVVFVVFANAFVTGVLSGVYERYQGRVVWLVPLLAGLLVSAWWQRER